MRQTMFGLAAAFAVMTAGAVPAMACGFDGCSPCGVATYVSPCAPAYVPTYTYTGCGGCGWGFDRLADPLTQYHTDYAPHQYYYVNQGPTYTGPGAFAPYPRYEEATEAPGYGYGYHHYHHRWHGYAPRYGYYHHMHHEPYYYGRPVLRRYY